MAKEIRAKIDTDTRDTMLEGFDEGPTGADKGWANESFVDSYWNGTKTTYHFQDQSMFVQKSYDPEPFLKNAEMARQAERDAGPQRIGDTQKVGEIPEAVLSGLIAQGLTDDELSDALFKWMQDNPLMAWTEKQIGPKANSEIILL